MDIWTLHDTQTIRSQNIIRTRNNNNGPRGQNIGEEHVNPPNGQNKPRRNTEQKRNKETHKPNEEQGSGDTTKHQRGHKTHPKNHEEIHTNSHTSQTMYKTTTPLGQNKRNTMSIMQ